MIVFVVVLSSSEIVTWQGYVEIAWAAVCFRRRRRRNEECHRSCCQ